MIRNDELIGKVLNHIELHPEEWDQGAWFCGTTACFAGRALLMSGYRIIDTYVEPPANAHLFDPLHREEMVDPEGNVVLDYSVAARRILGLSDIQAVRLFSADVTDIEKLRVAVSRIQEGL